MPERDDLSLAKLVAQLAPHPAIAAALDAIPASLLLRSGSVFYSGRAAFTRPSKLYILGLNPGGDPAVQAEETIRANRQKFQYGPAWWRAAYRVWPALCRPLIIVLSMPGCTQVPQWQIKPKSSFAHEFPVYEATIGF